MSHILDLIKQELSNEDSQIKARGRRIFNNLDVPELPLVESSDNIYLYNIPSESGGALYEVSIELDFEHDSIQAECGCMYYSQNLENCKHIVCALYIIEKEAKIGIAKGMQKSMNLTIVENVKEQFYTTNFTFLSENNLSNISPRHLYFYNQKIWKSKDWILLEDKVKMNISFQYDKKITTCITHIDKNKLKVECTCLKITSKEICDHAMYLFMMTKYKFKAVYFMQYEDWSNEKNQILKPFGLTLDDRLAKSFEFDFNYNGNLILTEKPSNILNANQQGTWNDIRNKLSIVVTDEPTKVVNTKKEEFDKVVVQLSINQNEPSLSLSILGIRVKKTGPGKVYKKMLIRNAVSLPLIAEIHPQAANILSKVSIDLAETMIMSPNSNWYDQFTSRQKTQWIIKLKNCFKSLSQLENPPDIVIEIEPKVYQNVYIKSDTPTISFLLSKEKNFIALEGFIILSNEKKIPLIECTFQPWFLLKHQNNYYIIEDEIIDIIQIFSKDNLYVPLKDFDQFNREFLKPLAEKYTFDYDDSMQIKEKNYEHIIPTLEIQLGEVGNDYLTFIPQWKYEQTILPFHSTEISQNHGTLSNIIRNTDIENEYRAWIESLHSSFVSRSRNLIYLTLQEATLDGWFFNFLQKAEEKQVIILGKNQLKNFNYNTAVPEINVVVGNGIDWFDVKIEVNYDGLVVSLAELKKAILSQQKFIKLSDGSLGMIPEEWLEKYAYLLKSAKLKDDKLQVSKFQWTIIDSLYDQLSDDDIAQELARKKELLHNIDKQNTFPIPKKLKANLRDYQQSGFQWLCTLDSLEWGACLADDMGLGKTLQTLSFLTHLKSKETKTHLIVCPTSLIYNWEGEILKFCKHLKYHIHYGADRERSVEQFKNFDIIITSYGMIRSDIKELNQFKFDYVILDESHTIKNPAAQMAKAVSLLKCKNRIALSGTPLQNNTMDIYSQMNFLNPGMLGSLDSFKSEFATPIDKHGDKNKIELLRKILYPFMLRRTKEQVAKDLPDKTEMILWCEMETKQRKVYNSFKEYYRKLILNKIDEDGMNKSSFFILEGLLKLRQICDSPAILNEDIQYPNDSIKIEEITRELNENTGSHKALVFSQFVSMLKLIEAELIKNEIPYLYLDGSTKASERRNLVKKFQEGKSAKVMLISLKAGGVGLNLTAADYVYLVDPWWNPAVEQQAIDRTHRIGQTQKVFAYKMICKDSIEEKILLLQDKKKTLSADIISGEASFIKKLTRDDIKYLFS